MKDCSTILKAPGLKHHHQIIYCHIRTLFGGGLTLSSSWLVPVSKIISLPSERETLSHLTLTPLGRRVKCWEICIAYVIWHSLGGTYLSMLSDLSSVPERGCLQLTQCIYFCEKYGSNYTPSIYGQKEGGRLASLTCAILVTLNGAW